MATSKPKEAILPKDMRDPTGVDALERRAMADMWRRLKKVLKVYKDALDRIPASPVVNAKYAFRLDAALLASLMAQFDFEVDQILLEGGEQRIWLFESYVTLAATQGIAQEYRNLARQSEVYRNQRGTVADILRSQPHVRRMNLVRTRVFEDMKGFNQAVKSDMARVLTDGIGRGLNPLEIARNLTQQIDIKRSRANTIARTEVTTALRRAAMDEADDAREEFGIRTLEMHISALSATTRATHAARHGKLYTTDEEREWWSKDGNSINCYLPGTKVAGRFVAGSKSFYDGHAIKIVTASGRNLSVTPNHPIMTTAGLMPAHKIREGDDLLAYSFHQENSVGVSALDAKDAVPVIDEVFTSLSELGHTYSARVHAVDFHGDAQFMDENVEIVDSCGMLTCCADTKLFESLDYLSLKHTDSISPSPRGSFFANGFSLTSSNCIVSFAGKLLSLFRRHFAMPIESTSASISNTDIVGEQNSPDNRSRDAKGDGYCLLGLTAGVSVDNVIAVEMFHFCGHVYDLQEVSGLMLANGLIASNCKCSRTSVLVDSKNQPLVPEVIARAKAIKQKMEKRDYNWSKD